MDGRGGAPFFLATLRASATLSLEMLVQVRCIWVSRQNCCWKLELQRGKDTGGCERAVPRCRSRPGKKLPFLCNQDKDKTKGVTWRSGRLLERDQPELEGQVTGGATRAPGDVNEKGLKLPHPLDALIEVLHACARKSRKIISTWWCIRAHMCSDRDVIHLLRVPYRTWSYSHVSCRDGDSAAADNRAW